MSDVDELRALARRVSHLASQTRGAAGQMRTAQGVHFVSKAADRYKEELRDQATTTEGAAHQLDDAAQALLNHAADVERTLARITSIEHWFGARLADAKREVASAAKTISHASSEILDHAPRAPAPGSPEWIDFVKRWGV